MDNTRSVQHVLCVVGLCDLKAQSMGHYSAMYRRLLRADYRCAVVIR